MTWQCRPQRCTFSSVALTQVAAAASIIIVAHELISDICRDGRTPHTCASAHIKIKSMDLHQKMRKACLRACGTAEGVHWRGAPVALAIGLVVLLVVCHKVAQCEAVVCGDEVDAVLGASPSQPLPAAIVRPPAACTPIQAHPTIACQYKTSPLSLFGRGMQYVRCAGYAFRGRQRLVALGRDPILPGLRAPSHTEGRCEVTTELLAGARDVGWASYPCGLAMTQAERQTGAGADHLHRAGRPRRWWGSRRRRRRRPAPRAPRCP